MKNTLKAILSAVKGWIFFASPSCEKSTAIDLQQVCNGFLSAYNFVSIDGYTPDCEEAGIAASNEFQLEQGDTLFVPFGDYPFHAPDGRTVIQRFDANSGKSIEAQFNSLLPRRRPVYEGHPDVEGMETRWPDKKAYGWIKSAQQTSFNGKPGIQFLVKWSKAARS